MQHLTLVTTWWLVPRRQYYACKFLDDQLIKKKKNKTRPTLMSLMIRYLREPNLKRTICKCCQGPLIPGETARVRLVSKPIKSIKWTCLTCMNSKRYPTKKGYKIWLDEPESIVETLDFTPNKNVQKPGSTDTSEKVKEQTENPTNSTNYSENELS